MSAIPAYTGRPSARRPNIEALREASCNPPLETELSDMAAAAALRMFRAGEDTRDIAWALEATEGAVYAGLWLARQQERAAA